MLNIVYLLFFWLNVTELLEVMYITGNIDDEACKDALKHIKKKKKDGYWTTDHIYRGTGYVSFDKRGGKGEWVSFLLEKYIEGSI